MRKSIIAILLLLNLQCFAGWGPISSTNVCAGGLGTTTYTTSAVNTTGGDTVIGTLSTYNQDDTHATITDNKGNGNPTKLPCQNLNIEGHSCIFYWKNATVGASHTFSVVGDQVGAHGVAICVTTFSGGNLTAPYDTPNQKGNTSVEPASGPFTLNTTSYTPSAANYLSVSGLGTYQSGTLTGPTGYSGVTTIASGVIPTCGFAYKIQSGGPSAENPGWTISTPVPSQSMAVTGASFAAASGGATNVPIPPFAIQ